MGEGFFYTFPAIRGVQATREFYVAMFPLNVVPKIFVFDDDELDTRLRSQRTLNKARVPAICDYIVNNPTEYVFSALTASVDADVEFVPVSGGAEFYNVGHVRIPISARFVINDGQHRRAAIEAALKKRPELGNETIPCVLFMDLGLKRSQQMFADLNRHAVRPTQSLNILYDHRDPFAQLVKEVVDRVPIFSGLTELDKTNISNRSPRLFTLSGIYRATRELLGKGANADLDKQLLTAVAYWNEVAQHMPDWQAAKQGRVAACDLRRDYIHAHTVCLVALGRVGAALMAQRPHDWRSVLKLLDDIDWRRSNSKMWEGRATVGGKLAISHTNVTLLTNGLKHMLGLSLSDEEQEIENAFARRAEGVQQEGA